VFNGGMAKLAFQVAVNLIFSSVICKEGLQLTPYS
jgi:hypothetical protein